MTLVPLNKEKEMMTVRRRRRPNHQMDTLQEHLKMFKRRQERLKQVGNLTLKEVLKKVNDPEVYRRARNS